jgi:phage-related protein
MEKAKELFDILIDYLPERIQRTLSKEIEYIKNCFPKHKITYMIGTLENYKKEVVHFNSTSSARMFFDYYINKCIYISWEIEKKPYLCYFTGLYFLIKELEKDEKNK